MWWAIGCGICWWSWAGCGWSLCRLPVQRAVLQAGTACLTCLHYVPSNALQQAPLIPVGSLIKSVCRVDRAWWLQGRHPLAARPAAAGAHAAAGQLHDPRLVAGFLERGLLR